MRKCKCGNEIEWGESIVCRGCRRKEDEIAMWVMIGLVVAFFVLLFGARFIWANIVFDDWRCALSECRIIK
jgi:hypothetical protein